MTYKPTALIWVTQRPPGRGIIGDRDGDGDGVGVGVGDMVFVDYTRGVGW